MIKRYCVQVGFRCCEQSPIELIKDPKCFVFRCSADRWMRNMQEHLRPPYWDLWIDKI